MKEYETLQVKKWRIHNVDGFQKQLFNLLVIKPTLVVSDLQYTHMTS